MRDLGLSRIILLLLLLFREIPSLIRSYFVFLSFFVHTCVELCLHFFVGHILFSFSGEPKPAHLSVCLLESLFPARWIGIRVWATFQGNESCSTCSLAHACPVFLLL